jgi:hypothetical protein
LFINRNVLTQNVPTVEEAKEFGGSCSASCRIGSNSLVLGQVCLKESTKVIVKDKLTFNLKLTLQKDLRGMTRRDVVEEKESQITGLMVNKIKECLNFNITENEKPIEILMSLNVI